MSLFHFAEFYAVTPKKQRPRLGWFWAILIFALLAGSIFLYHWML